MEEFSGKGWSSWAEGLMHYFEANGIRDGTKKRAVLLTLCGPSTFETVKALVAPKSPSEFTFEEIVALFQAHFDPRPAELFCRCKFQRRDQQPEESVTAYVAALKKLAADCNFGNVPTIPATPTTSTASTSVAAPAAGAASTVTTTVSSNTTMLPMDIMLRDRFVCGLRNENLQQRLFAERDLTFLKAFDIAVRAESAKDHQRQIKADFQEINKTEKSRPTHRQQEKTTSSSSPCYRCGEFHNPSSCKFRTSQCRYCKKTGHIAKACIKKKKSSQNSVQTLEPQETCNLVTTSPGTLHDLYAVTPRREPSQKVMINLEVQGVPLKFEVDSGAAFSLVSEQTFRASWPSKPPEFTNKIALRTWSGEGIESLGTVHVMVQFKKLKVKLPLLVMKHPGCNLLGRNWFAALGIGLSGVHQVVLDTSLTTTIEKYAPVFDRNLNCYNGPAVSLELEDNASPKFLRARTVPFALKTAVEAELQRLTKQGILEQTQHSNWATPVVLVRKKNGSIRLCGDYRSTVNAVTLKASYPLPRVTEVLAKLRGGRIFSTLDLAQAYQQLPVTEKTSEVLTINTIKGLYRVKRLPFGVSAAPAIFQRCMETTLAGIPGVSVYLDDIIVSGATAPEHAERLDSVLSRLQETGLRANREKCLFGVPEVTYLGHKIDAVGVHPTDDKIKAFKELPEPTSKATLQSFLGMLAFYDRFLDNRATVACDLYKLLVKNAPWKWEERHALAFLKLKELVLRKTTLAHYDESKPLMLSCDASPYGVGAVLAQVDHEGREAPIAFASRTLGDAEKNYSQLDREGLALVFGAVHFHQYIAGRSVVIVTDHQPLLGILGSQKPVPQVLSPRMRRWCVKLSAYNYELVYRPGKRHQNADVLSRLPLPDSNDEPCSPGDILIIEALTSSPLTAEKTAAMTRADPTLSRVYEAYSKGSLISSRRRTSPRTERKAQRCPLKADVSSGDPGWSYQPWHVLKP